MYGRALQQQVEPPIDSEEEQNEKILFGRCDYTEQEIETKNDVTPHLGSTCTAQFNEYSMSLMSGEMSGAKQNTRTVSIDGDPFQIEFGAQTYHAENNSQPHLNDHHFRQAYNSAESDIKLIQSSTPPE